MTSVSAETILTTPGKTQPTYDVSNFSAMSNEELNGFIDSIAKMSGGSTENGTDSPNVRAYSNVQSAWLAAAQIARNMGYPCAALMVECSVRNINYSESVITGSTLLITKLRTTSAYNSHLSTIQASGQQNYSGSFSIFKGDNADLFYALHTVATSAHKIGGYYMVTVSDVFDFALDNNYNDLFTTSVNNWTWLCQQTNVLHPISITLSM